MANDVYINPDGKPVFYVSKVTGKKYDYSEYINHGEGGFKRGFKDLPSDEYPYGLEYKPIPKSKWKIE